MAVEEWRLTLTNLERLVAEGRATKDADGTYYIHPGHHEDLPPLDEKLLAATKPAPDFSCIPCAGHGCYARSVVERKTCTEQPHPCPVAGWLCRCCEDCARTCALKDADDRTD